MITNILEIAGKENCANNDTPLNALISFYRAFNSQDIDALADNWVEGERPSMDSPIGGIRRGWSSIRDGYQKLFSGPAKVLVSFHDFTSDGGEDWHLFVGREKGVCVIAGTRINLRIRTTHWFIKITSVQFSGLHW
jgi:hypothetical protein